MATEEVKLRSSYDAFREHNAPTYDYVDKWGNDRRGYAADAYTSDYMTQSSDTGRNLRWVYVLHDGREVSLESYLKAKHPKLAGRVSSGRSGLLRIWNQLSHDEKQTILDGLPWKDILPSGTFGLKDFGKAVKSVERWLIDNRHPLAQIAAHDDSHINFRVEDILKGKTLSSGVDTPSGYKRTGRKSTKGVAKTKGRVPASKVVIGL